MTTTANPATNGRSTITGFRVIDPEGVTHNYPEGRSVLVDRCDLYVHGEDGKTIAIFHRWDQAERIA